MTQICPKLPKSADKYLNSASHYCYFLWIIIITIIFIIIFMIFIWCSRFHQKYGLPRSSETGNMTYSKSIKLFFHISNFLWNLEFTCYIILFNWNMPTMIRITFIWILHLAQFWAQALVAFVTVTRLPEVTEIYWNHQNHPWNHWNHHKYYNSWALLLIMRWCLSFILHFDGFKLLGKHSSTRKRGCALWTHTKSLKSLQ